MAGVTSSAKELWVQISGTSMLVSKELVLSVLNENADRILAGTLFYKELDQSSPRAKKVASNSQNEFIKKLSVFLNLEEKQAFDLFCSYLLHEYKGTRSQIKELLCNERNIQVMINKIWSFYCKERIYLLICLKHILSHWQDSKHPYQKLYENFIQTHDKPEDKILNNVVNQLEILISGPLVDKTLNGHYLTENLLQDWSEFRLKEQSELLQILLVYFRGKEPSGTTVIRLLSLFQRNSFGQRQPFRVHPHLHKQHLDLVGHLEVLVFMECLQLDYLLGCTQENLTDHYLLREPDTCEKLHRLVGMLGKHSQHGGALLAWLLARNMTVPTEDLAELAARAFRLGAFDSLHSALVALESHGSVVSSLAQNVVYSLLSVLLTKYRLESLGEIQKFFKLVETILVNTNIANDIWDKGMDCGIGLLLDESLHQFPLKLLPLLKLLKPLAQAGQQSCKKVLELMGQLPVYTQSLDSLPPSIWVQHPQLGCLELVSDYYPYHRENFVIKRGTRGVLIQPDNATVQWDVKYNGWEVLLLELNTFLNQPTIQSQYISDPAHQVLNILSEFVGAISKTDSSAFPRVQPIVTKFLELLPRICFMSNPPIDFIASCIHLLAFLPEEIFGSVWSGLVSEYFFPCVTNTPKPNTGGEIQFSMGMVGQMIAGADCVSGTYTLCRSFLQFTLDHLKRIPSSDHTLQGCVAYILQDVFPALFKWKYANPQEKLQIGQSCLTIFHTILSKSFDKKNSQSTMVDACLQHLLHGPASKVLLHIVCTGEENLDSVYGQEHILVVRLSLSILNQLFLHKVSSSSLQSPIMKGTGVVLTIAYYSFQKYSPQLATLSVQLLKRFAKAYPMSLLAFFGTEAESVRDQLLFRLNSAREDIRLKVALLEFLTVCVTSQPGIFEMFINVDTEDKELGELGSCLYSVLDILKDNKQSVVYCPRILHTATVEFIHSLWAGYQMLAIEQLKKQPDAWELMVHPLTSDFSSVNPKTMAFILQTLGLEIFYSCTLEGKLDSRLEKLLKKVEEKNLLLAWAQYLEAQLDAPPPEDDSLSSSQERDEDLLFLLTAWKTFLTVTAKFSQVSPLQLVTKVSSTLLTNFLDTFHQKMKQDAIQSHLLVLSEIIFTILSSVKDCPPQQLQSWSEPLTEILRIVAPNQPRFILPILAIVSKLLKMTNVAEEGRVLEDWLEPLLSIYKNSIMILQMEFNSAKSDLSTPLKSLPISVTILSVCVLRQVVLQIQEEEVWLGMFQRECMFSSLTNLLLNTLTLKKGLPLAYSLFQLLLTLSESRAAAEALTNTGVVGSLVLVLPNNPSQRTEEDTVLWHLVIRLVTQLLSKLSYFFLNDALNFIGFHLEALCQAMYVVKMKPTAQHLQEVLLIVTLFQHLSKLQHAWMLHHPHSQKAVLGALGQLVNTVVAYLMKPLHLQHVLKSLGNGEVSQLDFDHKLELDYCSTPAETPSKKTPPQLRFINYRLYQILAVSVSLLHHFSPHLDKILAQQGHEADSAFFLGISFNSPSLDRDRPLCFGTLLSAANVCLKFLTKSDTSDALPESECQVEERPLVHLTLESVLSLVLSQSHLVLTQSLYSSRDKLAFRRDLEAEMNSITTALSRFVKRTVSGDQPMTCDNKEFLKALISLLKKVFG